MGWKKITTLGDMKVDSDPTDATDFAGADVLFNHINGKLWFLKNDSTSMWSLTLDADNVDHIDQTNLNLQLVDDSFTDGLGSAIDRLIGGDAGGETGNWFEIEELTFGVEYINGPPTSVTIEETGADPDLTILDAGTSAQDVSIAPKNLVAIPYPARVGSTHLYDQVRFKITVEGPGGPYFQYENTTHYKFYNQIRYGITTETSITQSVMEDDLTNTDWLRNDDDHEGTRSFTPGTSGDNYISLVVPLTGTQLLSANGFRYNGYTMAMTFPSNTYFINAAGHREYFKIYRSLLANMGNADMETFISTPAVINHHFSGVTTSAVGSIDPEDGTDLEHDDSLDLTQSWGSINAGSGEHVFISYGSTVHGTIANGTTTAFRIDGITAGFETDTVSYQNNEGYQVMFRNYKCLASDTGNKELTTTGGSTVINEVRWGTINVVNTAGINLLAESDTTDDLIRTNWDDPGTSGASTALCIAYSPAHIQSTELTDTRNFRIGTATSNAVTAQFTKTTLTHTNQYGYEDTYDVWKADTADTGGDNFYTYDTTLVRYHYFAGGTSWAVDVIVPPIGDTQGTTTSLTEERDWGTINTASDYAYIAYDSAASGVLNSSTTGFRIDNVTAKFYSDTHTYTNPYDYPSTYYFYRAAVGGLGYIQLNSDGGHDWSDYIHVGVTQDEAGVGLDDDTINNDLTVKTLLDEAVSTTVLDITYSPGDSSTNEFVTIAFPTLATPKPASDEFRLNDIAAGFDKQTDIEHTNAYAYEHDYEVWQCKFTDTGNFTLRMSDSYGDPYIRNHSYIGVFADNEYDGSGVNISVDLEAINANAGNTFQNTSKANLAVADGEYIWFAYPTRYPDPSAKDFRLEGLTAGFHLDDTQVIQNEFGYPEFYDIWISDQPGTNLIAAPDFEVDNTFDPTAQNHQMYGGITPATYNQAFLDSLVALGASISNDTSQTAATGYEVTSAVGKHTYIAFPSRLNTNVGYFRYDEDGTSELQAGFTPELTDFNYRNQAGYEEDYDLFKSVTENLPDGRIGWGQASVKLTYYMGLVDPAGTDVLTEAEVKTLTDNDFVSSSTSSHQKTWADVAPGTDQHIAIAVPNNCNNLDVSIDYDGDNDGNEFITVTGGLTQTPGFVKQSDLSITNGYGYQKDYDIYISKHPDIGTGNITLTTLSSKQIRAHMYIGYNTATSATDNLFGVTAFQNTWAADGDINETVAISGTTSSDKYDTYTVTVDESDQYIWYIYPKRLGLVEAFYFDGSTFEGGMNAAETISLCNEVGWTEDYYAYRSENPGINEGGTTTLLAASS